MTVPTDLRRCTAHYVLSPDGYSGGALVDRSERGNDMPLAFGSTPTFTTRSGVACADLDMSYYFETLKCMVPCLGSVVMKFHTDCTSTDGALDIIGMRSGVFLADDHAALTSTGDWWDHDNRFIGLQAVTGTIRVGDRKGIGPGATASFALSTWHVATFVWDGGITGTYTGAATNTSVYLAKARIGAATTVATSVDPANPPPGYFEDIMRLGYLKAAGSIGGGRHLSLAEIAFFHDDILLNQPELAASLVASWS